MSTSKGAEQRKTKRIKNKAAKAASPAMKRKQAGALEREKLRGSA